MKAGSCADIGAGVGVRVLSRVVTDGLDSERQAGRTPLQYSHVGAP